MSGIVDKFEKKCRWSWLVLKVLGRMVFNDRKFTVKIMAAKTIKFVQKKGGKNRWISQNMMRKGVEVEKIAGSH